MERAAAAKAQPDDSACAHRMARMALRLQAEARWEDSPTEQEGARLTGLCQPDSVRALRHRGLVRLQLGRGQFRLLKWYAQHERQNVLELEKPRQRRGRVASGNQQCEGWLGPEYGRGEDAEGSGTWIYVRWSCLHERPNSC